jgi:tetratricopeptide (TPR) repeat protein
LFEAALDQAAGQRVAWLDQECAGDAVLRGRVLRLLEADTTGTEAGIERGPPPRLLAAADVSGADGIVGQRIGRYTVRAVLGIGGMSAVFAAEQDQPRRTVALKTMRSGLLSESARKRFALESEILGRLKHPAIAEVYEAGTWREPLAGSEIPFFAMELVAGARPLDRFVRDEKLGLRATVALFAAVCDGVAHGHALGFVHRDLKPANILVDEQGSPRIIDFGIARATESDLAATTLLTEAGQVLGTMQYMAPEQIDGRAGAADQRADVYALGVILYELLGNAPPFPARDHSITSYARLLRETEPPALPAVPREIEWVLQRALRADAASRYPDARAFAEDLRRFLRSEPLTVGPPSTAYRLHKFLRRHRVLVAVLAVLVIGITGTTTQWVRADHAKRLAQQETAKTDAALGVAQRQTTKAERVNAFLVDLIQSADPYERGSKTGGRDMTLRELLENAAARLDRLRDQPDAEADLCFNLGNALRSLGQLERAKTLHARALELRRSLHGAQHADVGEAENGLALTMKLLGDFDAAETHYRSALATFSAVHGSEHRQIALIGFNLGNLLLTRGRLDEADAMLRDAVALCERLPGENTRFLATGLGHLALAARARGDHAGVIACCRRALAAYDAVGENAHPYAAMTREQLGMALLATGDADAAVTELRAAVAAHDKAVGADNENAGRMRCNLASALFRVRAFAAAEAELRIAIPVLDKTAGPQARSTLEAQCNLLAALVERGALDEARTLGTGLLEVVPRVLGEGDAFAKRLRERMAQLARQ